MDEDERKAIEEMKSMSLEELNLVDHKILKWCCSGKKCKGYTRIRDYGIHPEYYHKGLTGPDGKTSNWINIREFYFMCGKHTKMLKRLSKNYDKAHVERKIFDFNKPKIIS